MKTNPWKSTSIYIVAAGGLLGASIFMSWKPATSTSFDDKGELFYADFTDPLEAQAIEVTRWDETLGTTVPFKVEFKDGKWVLPSHHNYPADAATALKDIASSFLGMRKEDIRSDDPKLQEQCSVIDPLDQSVKGTKGRGQRVTFRDASGKALADYIIGAKLEKKPKYRYIRVPGSNRIYTAKVEKDVSTRLADWVETDLLKLDSSDIERMTFNNYSYDEFQGAFTGLDTFRVMKEGTDWKFDGTFDPEKYSFQLDTVRDAVSTLDSLSLVDVEPKGAELADAFKGETRLVRTPDASTFIGSNRMSLLDKLGGGYYLGSRAGQNGDTEIFILANEGELVVELNDGLVYALRFGDATFDGPGDSETDKADDASAKANRYIMVTVDLDPSIDPEPAKPEQPTMPRPTPPEKPADGSSEDNPEPVDLEATQSWQAYDDAMSKWNADHTDWKTRNDEARKTLAELRLRFANWFYVIADDEFRKLRLSRSEVLKVAVEPTIETLKAGDGEELKDGQTALVRYTGWLLNADGSRGMQFDSNLDAPEPLEAVGVIEGWKLGLKGMKVGEKRKLIIPPEIGYGDRGSPPKIPPHATLVFEVELVGIKDK